MPSCGRGGVPGAASQLTQLSKALSPRGISVYRFAGSGQLMMMDEQTETAALGFDPLMVTSSVTVGMDPMHSVNTRSATVFYGHFDPRAIGTALSHSGFKKHGTANDGGTLWAVGDDNKPTKSNKTGDEVLNVIDVTADRVVTAGSTADVETFAGPVTTSLATVPTVAALAGCLGPAKSAILQTLDDLPGKPIAGFGLTTISTADLREEACTVASSPQAAQDIASNFVDQATHGDSVIPDVPNSLVLPAPQGIVVASSPPVVRLSVGPSTSAGGMKNTVGHLIMDFTSSPLDLAKLIN